MAVLSRGPASDRSAGPSRGSADAPARVRSLFAGLAAGAVAAVVASLVSLPLRSPDDIFANTASVTVGALLAGLFAGYAWWAARRRRSPFDTFVVWIAALFAVVALSALLSEDLPALALRHVTDFVIPLAGIVAVVVALLTPVFARRPFRAEWLGPAGAVAALALGVALAGRGDAESGRLALPELPRPASQAAPEGAAAPRGGAPANDGLIRPRDVAGVPFTVVLGESSATYTVREKLARLPLPNDAVGRTTQITGTIYLDGQPSRIVADLRTLQSDQPMRDNYIRSRGGPMFDRYPYAEFTVNGLDLPAEYRPGETITRYVTGTMKIREVERPTTFAVEARMQDGVLYILGRTDFTWDYFQIPPPNIAGIVQVENNVHLEILLVAKQSP